MTDNNSLSRRRFLQATGGAASAVAIAGCTGNDGSDGSDGGSGNQSGNNSGGGNANRDMKEGYLQLTNSSIETLDPVANTGTAGGTVIVNTYDSLMMYPDGEAAVEQLLASEYESSDDNTTYTFTLKDATFHNGNDVTAQDFVYSFERLAASDNSRRTYFILDSLGVAHETKTVTQDGEETEVYKPGTLAVEAVDEKTLEITLEKPFHASLEMLAYASFAAVPEGIVGDVEGHDGEMEYNKFANNPVGCGPYQFESWEKGTAVEVSKFDDYHGTAAKNEGVHWQIIEDTQALYNWGQNKNADVIGIPSSEYSADKISVDEEDDLGREIGTYGPMRNGDTANYMSIPEISVYYVGFNMEAVPKPVRQAFAHAMNQQTMVEEVFKSRGEPAYHFTPPSIYPGGAKEYASHAEGSYPYGYNTSQLDKARQVMEDAGYGPDNMYEIQWTQYESTTWEDMAKILRDQLQSAHINMSIEKAPFSTLLKRGRNGNMEVYTLGWIADWPAPDNFLQLLNPPQTDTSKAAPTSYINWSSESGAAAQQATDAWSTISNNLGPTDQAGNARSEAYVKMEEANWEDVGFIPVYHSLGERFWYDWLDLAPHGGMGAERQKYHEAELSERK
ncbi:peptide/nickel transport system substrate-binding protein [Halogranum amylolyticum]|uniref:Peptide/nickel transport system substrate-binding protein n=1 Tax=Halogranum amylolyticum TaxID=660520 RepID=A0A1H8QZ24_9EURY|nr:ABC transporter substrate-binding protein [Halogranum amylolyticum]SEO59472.1 peptide/nickel transport system substrate-binding protein [Halogranum amylolyticum]